MTTIKKHKKHKIFYLIGEGYLGKKLKQELTSQGYSVIVKSKEDDYIKGREFAKMQKELDSEIYILFFSAPNSKDKISSFKDMFFEYSVIKHRILSYLKYKLKVVFAGSEIINYKDNNDLSEFDKNYISCNLMIKDIKDVNFFFLEIPYVYDHELMNKDSSFYYKVKKGFQVPEKDESKKIKIIKADDFINELKVKLLIFSKDSRFNYIETDLRSFQIIIKEEK